MDNEQYSETPEKAPIDEESPHHRGGYPPLGPKPTGPTVYDILKNRREDDGPMD